MEKDITQTTQTDMEGKVTDFSVQGAVSDGVSQAGINYYDNPKFSEYYGYYKEIPELKKAIDAFATWVLGKGFNSEQETMLERIDGRGDEDFLAVMWNMMVMKKVNGDSYAEIIRNERGDVVNIKPLSPQNLRTKFNKKGIIIGYVDRVTQKNIAKEKILHFSNDRTADEMGGTSIIPAVKWVIDAKNEAMRDWRRISHRSTIRILYVDEDNPTRLANLKKDYAEAIRDGELMILPTKKEDANFEDLQLPPVESFLAWLRYLDNQIFLATGVPKVIMGSVDSIPESGGKISYLTYEQIYSRETRELEADLWNQLAIRVTFNPPASIAEGVADEKSTEQTGFQPNDTIAGVGK
jgi:hypothetical protein